LVKRRGKNFRLALEVDRVIHQCARKRDKLSRVVALLVRTGVLSRCIFMLFVGIVPLRFRKVKTVLRLFQQGQCRLLDHIICRAHLTTSWVVDPPMITFAHDRMSEAYDLSLSFE
jgi:hypothetical protein